MLAVYAIDLTPREAYRRSRRGIITVENFSHTQRNFPFHKDDDKDSNANDQDED